ncbi:hypothetical protein [Methanobrevibacter sp.]
MNSKEKVKRIGLIHRLKDAQESVDLLYEQAGLTDEVLDLQLEINGIRHDANITDTKQLVFKNFVQ